MLMQAYRRHDETEASRVGNLVTAYRIFLPAHPLHLLAPIRTDPRLSSFAPGFTFLFFLPLHDHTFLRLSHRFNRLAWGHATADRPYGVIAGGMENGELNLWSAGAIIDNG